MAAVGYILCKYLRKAGHQADVVSFMDDRAFSFRQFYGGKHFQDQRLMLYYLRTIVPDYDIVHLHFSYPILPQLSFIDKPMVMHYHGTELATNLAECITTDRGCKLVLVAGEQMLQYHPRAKYLPTIVDTEHFKPVDTPEEKKGDLVFDISYLDTQRAILESGVKEPTVINRQQFAVPYSEMPTFLNKFQTYIDFRYHKERGLLTDRSKTGLEALACGLKVIDQRGITEGLPEQHKPELVVKQLLSYYEEIAT